MNSNEKAEKVRLSITLTAKQHDKIKSAAEELGVSISSYLSVAASEKMQRDNRKRSE